MRVLLADGEPDVRWALRLVLTHDLGMQVVGEAGDTAELWTRLHSAAPDLLLLDWAMFGPGATGAVGRLRSQFPRLCIVALSGHPAARSAALAAGAHAFVSKADAPDQLMAALKAMSRQDGVWHTDDGAMWENKHG